MQRRSCGWSRRESAKPATGIGHRWGVQGQAQAGPGKRTRGSAWNPWNPWIGPPISPDFSRSHCRDAAGLATADAFVGLETSIEISPSEDTPRTRTPPGGSEAFEKRTDCVAPWRAWVKQLARSVSDVPLTLPLPLPWSVGLPPLLSNETNGGIIDFAAIAARQLADGPSELEMPCLG